MTSEGGHSVMTFHPISRELYRAERVQNIWANPSHATSLLKEPLDSFSSDSVPKSVGRNSTWIHEKVQAVAAQFQAATYVYSPNLNIYVWIAWENIFKAVGWTQPNIPRRSFNKLNFEKWSPWRPFQHYVLLRNLLLF